MRRPFLYAVLISILIGGSSYAFDDKVTHPHITRIAVPLSSLDQYLVNSLNLENGVLTVFDAGLSTWSSMDVSKWLQKGSTAEDDPDCRASNHFHNPLKPWSESFMIDQPWYINSACTGTEYPPEKIKSTVFWATDYLEPAPDGNKADSENAWDWDHAREYFYIYLTGKDFQENEYTEGAMGHYGRSDEEIREYYMGVSLRSLGQVLHLLQDMAVPAHVRSDFVSHLEPGGVPGETFWNVKTWVIERFENYVKTHDDQLPTGSSGGDLTDGSLTKFWDANAYTGSNPSATTNSAMIGLAEYTNANFPSRDTILTENALTDSYPFNDLYQQPYPARSSTNVARLLDGTLQPETVTAPDNTTEEGFWIRKTGEGESGYRFAKVSALTSDVMGLPWPIEFDPADLLYIDDQCVKEYASFLVPKATGYSRGLINYFFRGSLQVSVPESQVYSIIEGINNPFWYTEIKAKVKNTTPGEEADQGSIRATVKYKVGSSAEYSFSTSKLITLSSGLSSSDVTEYTFDFSDDPVPSDGVDPHLFIIYRGNLGNERDNGIAVGSRSLFPNYVELSPPDTGTYGISPSQDEPFKEIKLRAVNVGPANIDLSDGQISLIVQYKIALEDPFQSKPVATSDQYYYTTAVTGSRSIPRGEPEEMTFDFSAQPIPVNATDLYLQLVYTATDDQGGENVAVGLKDMGEPTPFDLFSNMDKICIDSSWYDAGGAQAIALLDSDSDGDADLSDPYAHDLGNIFVRFSRLDNPFYATPDDFATHVPLLSAGQFQRQTYILTDKQFAFSTYVQDVLKTNPDDYWLEYYGTYLFGQSSITNQTKHGTQKDCCDALGFPPCIWGSDPNPYCCQNVIPSAGCEIRHYPSFNTFRGHDTWGAIVFSNRSYPADTCSDEDLQ